MIVVVITMILAVPVAFMQVPAVLVVVVVRMAPIRTTTTTRTAGTCRSADGSNTHQRTAGDPSVRQPIHIGLRYCPSNRRPRHSLRQASADDAHNARVAAAGGR